MKKYIIDFDYTVFDTNAMRSALQAELQKYCGVTLEQYQAAEKQITTNGALYSLDEHLEQLFPEADAREKGRAVAESVVQRMGEWVYPDALLALKELHNQAMQLVILSFGSRDWQELKIAHSGIAALVDTVEIVEGSKTEPVHLFQQNNNEKIVCINDRATEIDELYGVFPHVSYFWIARENTPYNKTMPTVPHQQISSFSEIIGTLEA